MHPIHQDMDMRMLPIVMSHQHRLVFRKPESLQDRVGYLFHLRSRDHILPVETDREMVHRQRDARILLRRSTHECGREFRIIGRQMASTRPRHTIPFLTTAPPSKVNRQRTEIPTTTRDSDHDGRPLFSRFDRARDVKNRFQHRLQFRRIG
jgi:hypothetical protein